MSFTKEEVKWMRDCPRQHTIVIAQPRSGSTLLMRLMGLVGGCDVVGDRDVSFYQKLYELWHHVDRTEHYGRLAQFEADDEFADTFIGESEDQVRSTLQFALQRMMMNPGGGCSPCKFMKIATLGFSEGCLDFSQLISFFREIHDHPASMPLQIVWLTRSHDEIVKSFQTTEGPGQEMANQKPEVVYSLLKEQQRLFKESYELEDICLTYENLIADPKKWLLKLKPTMYPIDWKIDRVMKKKLR